MVTDSVSCELQTEYIQRRSISVAGFSPLRLGFDLPSAHVTLGWTKWHGAGFYATPFRLSPVSVIPPTQHSHLHIQVALTEGQTDKAWEPSIKQCLKRTVAGLSSWRPGSHFRSVYVRFV